MVCVLECLQPLLSPPSNGERWGYAPLALRENGDPCQPTPPIPPKPARRRFDAQLTPCWWVVQDYPELNIHTIEGVAVRDYPLKSGFADHLLDVASKAVGVVEAVAVGHSRAGVET